MPPGADGGMAAAGTGRRRRWSGARRIIDHCGFNVATIDAPGHGGRPRTAHDEKEIATPRPGRHIIRLT
ncbi:hypothetical protein [Actinoallomurus sp. CA-142502]|uniref:hypothetical protein n=1 Tax=Actinoallomurus sp. CA-142502 TaxID=3239885 RepID=UPI003D8FC01C